MRDLDLLLTDMLTLGVRALRIMRRCLILNTQGVDKELSPSLFG